MRLVPLAAAAAAAAASLVPATASAAPAVHNYPILSVGCLSRQAPVDRRDDP